MTAKKRTSSKSRKRKALKSKTPTLYRIEYFSIVDHTWNPSCAGGGFTRYKAAATVRGLNEGSSQKYRAVPE